MFEKELTQVLEEQNDFPSYYCGGTLIVEKDRHVMVWFNINKGRIIDRNDEGKEYEYTSEEKKLVAQIYLKYKTPSHSFYAECLKILESLS